MNKRNTRFGHAKFLLSLVVILALAVTPLTPDTAKPALSFLPDNTPGPQLFNPGWLNIPTSITKDITDDNSYNYNNYSIREPADTVSIPKRLDLNRDYWKGFWKDLKSTFTSPLRWKGISWAKFGMITATTAMIYANDDGIMSNVQKNNTPGTVRVAKVVEKFGNPIVVVPGLLLFYSYGSLFKDSKAKETALLAFKGAVVSAAVVHVFKFIAHRHRPEAGPSSTLWDGPSFSTSNLSFPSGHSAAVFSIAAVICGQYKNPLVQVLSYTVAIFTSISRVHDRKHWASDVIFGAAIGYYTSRGILARKKKTDRGKPAKGLKLFPMIGFGSLGLNLSYNF
ncbi:MAG: phosphatase PAP2 family protein [bacterium]|nr:phosphatase PAP2 family protein [bacterium]